MASRSAVTLVLTMSFGLGCSDTSPAETPPVETPPVENPQAASSQAASSQAAPPSVEVECAPMRVTVDGVEKTLSHGFAVANPNGITVHRFEGDTVTCADVVAGRWSTPPGSTHAKVQIYGSTGSGGVGNRSVNGSVTPLGVVSPDQLNVGDTVRLCLDEEVELPRAVGRPSATVAGLFEGTYCGVRDI